MEDSIFAQMAGYDRLGLIPHQVGFRTVIDNTQSAPCRVCDCFMQNLGQSTLGCNGSIVTRNEAQPQRFGKLWP